MPTRVATPENWLCEHQARPGFPGVWPPFFYQYSLFKMLMLFTCFFHCNFVKLHLIVALLTWCAGGGSGSHVAVKAGSSNPDISMDLR
jgi:hypothetical protein